MSDVGSEKFAIAAGAMSPAIWMTTFETGITAIPAAGGTMRVFKSTSPRLDILADIADGSLSYANLIAGTQPTRSTWMLWAPGAVTATTNQGPIESAGDVALIATATGAAGRLEVAR
jgi:hypothetical protein